MANLAVPHAATTDQVFLTLIIERLDQLNEALERVDTRLAELEKQPAPIVNVNFDINALAKQLAEIQAQRDSIVTTLATQEAVTSSKKTTKKS